MRTRIYMLGCLISLAAAGACWAPVAAAEPATVKFANPASDQDSYLSDRIYYKFDRHVHRLDMTRAERTSSDACLPMNARLKVRGKATLDSGNGTPQEMLVSTVLSVPEEKSGSSTDAGPGLPALRCNQSNTVRAGDVVMIAAEDMREIRPHRSGLTYGTLLVPYKYQFRGDRSISGGSTLGGYLGYREAATGLDMQFIVFAGASNVSAQLAGSDGKVSERNLAALSYGVGVLGTLKSNFELGLVLGVDRAGRNSGYANHGKPWLALSLGFPFSN